MGAFSKILVSEHELRRDGPSFPSLTNHYSVINVCRGLKATVDLLEACRKAGHWRPLVIKRPFLIARGKELIMGVALK